MKSVRCERAEGQAVVQVAIAMVFLLAILALAIDVGHLYAERRRMQNAADAGALAGARALCFGDASQWQSEAEKYAALNFNPLAPAGSQTAEASLSDDGWTVTVVTTEPTTGWLARALVALGLFGQDTADVRAVAAAACGSATSSCALWPIVFDQDRWEELYDDGAGCGDDFFLWVGDNPNNPKPPDCEESWCDCFPDNNGDGLCSCTSYDGDDYCDCYDPNGDGVCECYDGDGDGTCEVDASDGDGFLDIFAQDGRAYVDLSGALSPEYPDPEECDNPGCGKDELGCWIRSSSGARISIGACLPDLSGERAAVEKDVTQRIGDHINVPLFDSLGCTAPLASDCTNGRNFHVGGFGCVSPLAYEKNYILPPKWSLGKEYKDNMIRVEIDCSEECETNCGGTGGEPPCDYCVRAVSLIR
ncbi:MAG TPA: Tad domain-containing protein [Anaerolineae bacterium]|nr:Tad domain-containing protein [Anaerolineae bacterium]